VVYAQQRRGSSTGKGVDAVDAATGRAPAV
jgi:hypothetical protein